MTEVAGPPAAGEAQLLPLDIELDIPVTDPPQLLKMHHYFDSLLQRTGWHILQDPAQANLFVTIKKLDVSGHPTGAFLSESVWRDCSVWDVKAIVCSMGARKLWDPTLEAALFLHQVSPTCSIWHNKTKGFWPVSPRDYVVFSGYYGTPTRVDLCVTSCTSETVGHITLPKNQPGYVRARLDLWAWRLERIDNSTTSVKLINQADLQGWIPSYIPNSFSGQSSDTIMQAHTYFNKHGAPPDLILLQQGSMVDVSYDHNRSSWRCEYIRSTEATIAIANLRDTEMSSTKAEIRLDGRRRTGDKSYNVVIDPPPTRVRATMRAYDPYGWWLEIVHDEEHIIPQRGKILTLIKPGSTLVGQESGDPELSINGVPMPVQKDITTQLKLQQEPGAVQQDGCSDGHSQEQQAQKLQMEQRQPQSPQQHDSLESIIESLPVSPVEHTQRALAFLEKMADQQFGWTTVSEKNKMQVSKRQGSKVPNAMESSSEDIIIPEQSVILKASKVIEGFSVEEVAAVVTDTGKLRTQYDDSIEEIERLLPLTHGCMLVRQVVKGGLFIKAKEVYASACTAIEKVSSTTNPAAKRVLHIEASIPNFPVPKSSKRQQVLFYISGWILEAIDPYTTTNNYPIPSTRVIFVSTLDLGAAVPTFFSNQITLGLHKKIHTLEGYLKQHGSPPYLTQPLAVEGFSGGKLHERIVKELYPDLGIAEWISVSSSFDRTVNSFKSSGIFRLLIPKRNASLAPSKPSNLSAVLKSKRHAPQSMASSPTFGSVGFKGKQSVGGESKENVTTQTGCPSDILSHGSGNNSGEPGGESLLFHLIVDLRSYPKGYEISTRLTRKGDEQKKDLSASLVCRVSERAPEPSQLIAGSKASQKHAIELLLTPVSRLGRDREYILEMDLTRVQEESLNKRGTRLTVSGVLGDEDNQWRGLLLLNGREIKIGANNECAVTTLPEESLLLEDLNGEDESAEEDEETRFSGTGTTNMGGGVVAAAIGGVSAGVSDIRARMLLPFRNASNSFLLSPIRNDSEESDLFSSAFSDSPPNSENGQQQEQQQQQQQQQQEQQHTTASPPSASVLAHAVFKSRRHRSSTNGIPDQYQLHDAQVTAKTIGWLILCLIFLLVFLFYIGSTTSPPLSGVEYTHERHLWSMPWIGGWHIQVRAIRQ
ncbi:hypothetical protein BX666DRAFT_1179722 [Dichotomocladium elegans]|nr:hypothetical protein BX666DRAFT_1179722 [Dichotomocladium elegans]